MHGRWKKKAYLMIAVELISLIVLGIFLTSMQTSLSVKNQRNDIQEKIQQMAGLLQAADEAAEQATASYDEVYQAKASSLAYMANKLSEFEYSDSRMEEYRKLLDVSNVLILDREGNTLAKARLSPADFTRNRYNQLRGVFHSSEAPAAFEVEKDGLRYRYYGAKIDYETMAVIEQDPAELKQLLEDTSTWKSILSNVSIGMDGYAFAVSNRDYTFLYHPDEELVGKDALDAGISVTELEEGNDTWLTVNGERFYCGVTLLEDAYIICAVPESEIIASRNITIGIVLFVFFAVITVVITYAVLMMADEEKNGRKEKGSRAAGGFIFNGVIGRKIGTIALIGLLLILGISYYMQTLFSLSRYSMSNNERVEEVERTNDHNEKEIAVITEQYNSRYLNKGRIASYILSREPGLANRTELAEMSRVLGVETIGVFDSEGLMTVTNASYSKFRISSDPENQSYEFNKLLNGADYVIQEAQPDELSGAYHQYIGVSLRDEEGESYGFVQIAVTPSKLEEALASTSISAVLSGVKTGVNGFAFAVNKEDKTFAYYPEEKLIGRKVLEYGMEEDELRDGYCDYITVGTERYYGSSLETGQYYIYVVIPEKEMTGTRGPIALASAGVSLICLAVVCLLLTFSRKGAVKETANGERTNSGPMIDVVMPDGSTRRTESAASRWANRSLGWDEKTPEQQSTTVIKGLISLLALVICAAVLFEDRFFDSNSIFMYVLKGRWERGINIFAMTACVMVLCVVSVATMVLRKLLQLLSKTFDARGETVCRLLSSFLKYVSVIAALYYCLALFGVDTATLLASAGILSLVIGLGAKTLVSDILAGLFIIFEGEFRVGDIVTVGDWRGTVMEIGVRTTKIEDPSKNIKIISNSDVNGVINMTRQHSFASCDVGIEYGESLERVENILAKELPHIKRRVPSIQEGPFYKGVVSLGDNSVNIRIVAQCAEADRLQLGRDLNREMKLIFDKYDINIPFPQIVLNQPIEYKEATAREKLQADRFAKEQSRLARELETEQEEEV